MFELPATHADGLTLSEIAARLRRTISELLRLLVVTERRGYLSKRDTDRYSITFRVLDLGFAPTRRRT